MSAHDTRHFLACRDCAVLQPVVHVSTGRFDDAAQDALTDYKQFVAAHAAHTTVRVRRQGSDLRADHPVWDPMATVTFAVTDGPNDYVVRAGRASIEEPRVYHFAPGVLEVTRAEVAIDEAGLRRGLDSAFYPHVLRASALDRFLAAVRELISDAAAEDLEIVFDEPDDPAVSIARLPDDVYERLTAFCADIFDPWEASRARQFLRDNRDSDGLLVLRVRQQFKTLAASAR